MTDLNFLKSIRGQEYRNSPNNLKKLILVFSVSFVLLLIIFNFPAIWGNINFYLFYNQDKENERLTEMYRQLYGYKGENSSQSLPLAGQVASAAQKPVQTSAPAATPANFSASIYIPKIDITAPIILPASTSTASILKALQSGVVLYPGSALPGEPGTSMIVGHSSSNYPWQKYSAVFALLNKLEPGDSIMIKYQGKELIYDVTAKKIGTIDELTKTNITADLVLGSCWPVGTDRNRIIVAADLIR